MIKKKHLFNTFPSYPGIIGKFIGSYTKAGEKGRKRTDSIPHKLLKDYLAQGDINKMVLFNKKFNKKKPNPIIKQKKTGAFRKNDKVIVNKGTRNNIELFKGTIDHIRLIGKTPYAFIKFDNLTSEEYPNKSSRTGIIGKSKIQDSFGDQIDFISIKDWLSGDDIKKHFPEFFIQEVPEYQPEDKPTKKKKTKESTPPTDPLSEILKERQQQDTKEPTIEEITTPDLDSVLKERQVNQQDTGPVITRNPAEYNRILFEEPEYKKTPEEIKRIKDYTNFGDSMGMDARSIDMNLKWKQDQDRRDKELKEQIEKTNRSIRNQGILTQGLDFQRQQQFQKQLDQKDFDNDEIIRRTAEKITEEFVKPVLDKGKQAAEQEAQTQRDAKNQNPEIQIPDGIIEDAIEEVKENMDKQHEQERSKEGRGPGVNNFSTNAPAQRASSGEINKKNEEGEGGVVNPDTNLPNNRLSPEQNKELKDDMNDFIQNSIEAEEILARKRKAFQNLFKKGRNKGKKTKNRYKTKFGVEFKKSKFGNNRKPRFRLKKLLSSNILNTDKQLLADINNEINSLKARVQSMLSIPNLTQQDWVAYSQIKQRRAQLESQTTKCSRTNEPRT